MSKQTEILIQLKERKASVFLTYDTPTQILKHQIQGDEGLAFILYSHADQSFGYFVAEETIESVEWWLNIAQYIKVRYKLNVKIKNAPVFDVIGEEGVVY